MNIEELINKINRIKELKEYIPKLEIDLEDTPYKYKCFIIKKEEELNKLNMELKTLLETEI
jgi:hypothetical protein